MSMVLAQIVLTEQGNVEALVNPNLQGHDPLAACAQGIAALAARQVQILNAQVEDLPKPSNILIAQPGLVLPRRL